MAVNPNIALSVRGLELPDPLTQYGKVQSIQQMQQQNALAQMQMQQLERETQQRNALNRAYSQAYTPTGELDFNKLASSLATGGFGSQIPAAQKSYFEGQEARTKQQKAESDLLTSKLQQSRSFLDTLNPNSLDAAAQYIAWHEANHADPVIGPALAARGVTVDTARAEIDKALRTPGGLQNLIARSAMGLEKFMEFTKPTVREVDTGTEKLLVETGLGQDPTVAARFTTEMTPAQTDQKERDERRLTNEDRRVAMEEERLKLEQIKNTPEFKEAMIRAETLGKEIARGDVEALQQLPVITSRVEQGLNVIDQMIGKRDKNGNLLEGQAPHPGFTSAVGASIVPFQRLVPGTEAANFMSFYNQIKGQAFLEAFESLKGGGQITEVEGAKATDALNRMNIAQSEQEFVKAAMEFQDELRKGLELGRKRAASAERRMGGTSIPSNGRFVGFD